MVPTRGAGVTAAAGTSLTHHLFAKLFTLGKKPMIYMSTWGSLITLSCIVKVSRLLHPVGLGPVSQCPSPGYRSHGPYGSSPWWAVTPPTS